MPVTSKRSHPRLTVISLAIITQFLVGAGPKLSEVEGLFYLDGEPVTITIKDGKIERIVRKDKLDHPAHAGVYVAPGFIDNQVNGYANVAFAGEGLTVEDVRQATRGLWEAGVTTYLPTLTTNTHQLLKTNFAVLVKALKDPELARSIPGYHLEGPYISPIDGYRGSHVQEWVRSPDWNEFMELYQASGKAPWISSAACVLRASASASATTTAPPGRSRPPSMPALPSPPTWATVAPT